MASISFKHNIPVFLSYWAFSAILKNNAIKLKVKGKALSDGNIGDIINVESHLKNRKYLKGEIVDSQHINIQTINF